MNKKEDNEKGGVKGWIDGDETAHYTLRRISALRSTLLVPPLHRVPLRLGNVIEIFGPSPSAKTQILIQVAINCVLPKEWNGVRYGGFDHSVLFLDLDCRFDISRLSQMLTHRIMEGNAIGDCDKTLYDLCMQRFLYARCSNSFEFLQTLKSLHYRLKREKDHGVSVQLLLIDRKKLFLQSVSEAVVQDIKKLLQVHPMLVIATKSVIFGNTYSTASEEVNGCSRNVTRSPQHTQYREYMPSVWQVKVVTDDQPVISNSENSSWYVLEWLLPRIGLPDKIIVKDVRTLCVDCDLS
ncbi:hypothetical protein Ahy_A03g016476 [Arachis hypogaea]|uniref:RecA family profile 1 domain-containing protein n=1 Tax=Arachis hypogaea TaxID=3818 RepID=A0A445E3E2_ARAHY|nr:hypothetical protein Ahy_A03g016476 [Arachis hypogaea]